MEVDEIYNLACPASPVHYQFDPVQTTKTNVHGSINMLGLAKRVKARILQASTSEVYGNPLSHPQSENYLAMLIALAQDPVMMKEKGVLKHFSWTITGSTISRSR